MKDAKLQKLSINAITVDSDFQPRAKGLDDAHVEEIADAYRNAEDVEPPVVWKLTDGKGIVLSQGFHRLEAARRAGLTHIECVVMVGTKHKCLIDAMTSNQKHGLKRSPEDRERCVLQLSIAMPNYTNSVIAGLARVSEETSRKIRLKLPQLPIVGSCGNEAGAEAPAKKIGKNGKSYTVPKPKAVKAAEVAAEPVATPEPVTLPDAAPTPAEQPSTGEADDAPAEVAEVVEPVKVPAKADPLHHIIDGLNNSIPRGLQDTWGDPALRNVVERIRAAHKELVSAANHVKNTLMPKGQYWPFASCPHAFDSLMNAADDAARAMSQVEAGLPFCVCLKCKGDGCQHCRQGGYLPKWKYENRETYGV